LNKRPPAKALVLPWVQLLNDFLRLLYARAADAYSYNTGEKMVSYSDEQIKTLIVEDHRQTHHYFSSGN
jgi:excinuclease UvrABC ATPase subunit